VQETNRLLFWSSISPMTTNLRSSSLAHGSTHPAVCIEILGVSKLCLSGSDVPNQDMKLARMLLTARASTHLCHDLRGFCVTRWIPCGPCHGSALQGHSWHSCCAADNVSDESRNFFDFEPLLVCSYTRDETVVCMTIPNHGNVSNVA
jgi:hypothetical protein